MSENKTWTCIDYGENIYVSDGRLLRGPHAIWEDGNGNLLVTGVSSSKSEDLGIVIGGNMDDFSVSTNGKKAKQKIVYEREV